MHNEQMKARLFCYGNSRAFLFDYIMATLLKSDSLR